MNAPGNLRHRSVNATTRVERKVRHLVPELTPLQTCGNRRNKLVALIVPLLPLLP